MKEHRLTIFQFSKAVRVERGIKSLFDFGILRETLKSAHIL